MTDAILPTFTPYTEMSPEDQAAFDSRQGIRSSDRARVEALTTGPASRDAGLSAVGSELRYVASANWGHIFVGRREEITRWVYDRSTNALACAQVQLGSAWVNLDQPSMADLFESIQDNEALSDLADFDLVQFESLPSWLEVEAAGAAFDWVSQRPRGGN